MKTLFALDSMALLYRSYFAMIRSPLTNTSGLSTGGLFGFVTQLTRILEQEKPHYLAVATDSAEPTFRHHQFPSYKATRDKMPDDLVAQLPYLPRMAQSLGLPYLKFPGYEADDIIGTLVRVCLGQSVSVVMVTSDKDYMQLITETISMLNHKQEKIGIPQVLEKFGCAPHQVIEVLGLMGDASDNIPGVKGVGEKTAIKLIQEYGSIENLYSQLDRISSDNLRQKLVEHRDQAFLSRELVTIFKEVPLTTEIEAFQVADNPLSNNPEFCSILEELEFKSLLKKFKPTVIAVEKNLRDPAKKMEESQESLAIEPQPTITLESTPAFHLHLIESWNALDTLVETLKTTTGVLAFDLLPSTSPVWERELPAISFCGDSFEVFYLSLEHPAFFQESPEVFRRLAPLFDDLNIPKIGHHLKIQIQCLSRHGIFIQGLHLDTLVASHLLTATERGEGLDQIVLRHLHWERQHPLRKTPSQPSLLDVLDTHPAQRLAENAFLVRHLYEPLKQQLQQTQMWTPFQFVEMRLIPVLAQLELAGVGVDVTILNQISQQLSERLETLRTEIHGLAGESFNINSIPELQKVLYERLQLHTQFGIKPHKIKIGNQLSTDEETLEKLSEHPLPRALLEYRELSKLKNTYVDQLPTFVSPVSHRIHSQFNQCVAATGRLSSETPNLQNIPIRTETGRQIRKAFVADGEENILISADYSQIELRVVAHYSKDPTFVQAYRDALDIHTLTASAIFKVEASEVTREMRSKAKEVNFGLIYKMGPERLALVTQTSKAAAKQFIERFFERYSTIRELQERFLDNARRQGYAETLMGRRRYLPHIQGRGLEKRFAEGAAINTPIQGTAAEIIKLAMISLDKELRSLGLPSAMILTVHDELLLEVPVAQLEVVSQLIKTVMEGVIVLDVPLTVEVGTGKNWLESH